METRRAARGGHRAPERRLARPTPLTDAPRATGAGLKSRLWRWARGPWTEEGLLLACAAFWTLAAQGGFLAGALKGREAGDPSTWGFALALGVGLTALHFLLLGLVAHRWTFKPVLLLTVVVTALAAHYIDHYNVYLDPSMLRNVLRTDPREAGELIGPALALSLALLALPPALLVWRAKPLQRPWARGLAVRGGSLLLALAALLGSLLAVFQPFASLMRNERELRYLITPANVVWSLAAVARAEASTAAAPKRPIGLDARLGPTWTAAARQGRPAVVVLVVGETARAANWGLSGYARDTTPELTKLPVINFAQVGACGTNTETSLPCMFAPVGRRDYDESRIRGQESLLHLLNRAGVGVRWIDNQSGCKGVCDGLDATSVQALNPPGLCSDGRCLDEGLLHGLEDSLLAARGPQLLVLHQLGNHGPSYFRRVPPAFEHFQPACRKDDLRRCSVQEIVNAYDNALRYTDHVLAQLVRRLQALQGRVDSAVVYVSDHGESLGEKNLFLHGIPYAIAPDVQTRVPMVMWFSAGFAQGLGLDTACLARRAAQPAMHDHLFHTLGALLDVRAGEFEPALDLTQGCRAGSAPR
jgi:lipid A ethanolaminephosphotransferase